MLISLREAKRFKRFKKKVEQPFKPEYEERGTERDFAYSTDEERAVRDRWQTDRMTQYR
jgi:hypothetical protein